MTSLCLIPSDVYLDYLVKMVSAKVIIFPFAGKPSTQKSRLLKYSFFSSELFCPPSALIIAVSASAASSAPLAS